MIGIQPQHPWKKIKMEFVKNTNAEISEFAKDLDLDDIIRVLPSGGCKIGQAALGDDIELL